MTAYFFVVVSGRGSRTTRPSLCCAQTCIFLENQFSCLAPFSRQWRETFPLSSPALLLNKLSCVPQSYLLRISTVPATDSHREPPPRRGSTVSKTTSLILQQRSALPESACETHTDRSLSYAKRLLIYLKTCIKKDLCSRGSVFDIFPSQLSDLFDYDSQAKCQSAHSHDKKKKKIKGYFLCSDTINRSWQQMAMFI